VRKNDKGTRREKLVHQKRREREGKQTEEGGRKREKMENLCCWLKRKKKRVVPTLIRLNKSLFCAFLFF
jgi:hypothetical protein